MTRPSNFKNPANVFCEYALSHSDLDDYTHSRITISGIVISRHAAKEIWPTVTDWIAKHST